MNTAIIPKLNRNLKTAPLPVLFVLSKCSLWVAGLFAYTLAPKRKMNHVTGTLAAH